ncbi:uncharacterized protein C2845_PM03G32520 [Panicum miliaceum]|uniref:DUF4220 domain-containing protein n=1 Tax=Panicum miliaceum TaxID=4540 RepID=A0A3L6T5Z1_PANMI|nr:uncharacterized protein C2845_PM03G32520 [Panicum miliaceum]
MIAVYALGFLSRNEDATTRNHTLASTHQLAFLWAPFLLIHLGGQDTVTALSIEDNKLWLRHLLNLVMQVALSLYVFWKSIGRHNVQLLVPGIFVFVTGIIKYGETTLLALFLSGDLKNSNVSTGEESDKKLPQLSSRDHGMYQMQGGHSVTLELGCTTICTRKLAAVLRCISQLRSFPRRLCNVYDGHGPGMAKSCALLRRVACCLFWLRNCQAPCNDDNGEGIRREDISQMLGKFYSSSKKILQQARGKFGLGIKMLYIYSNESTSYPVLIRTAQRNEEFISQHTIKLRRYGNHFLKKTNQKGWAGTEVVVYTLGLWDNNEKIAMIACCEDLRKDMSSRSIGFSAEWYSSFVSKGSECDLRTALQNHVNEVQKLAKGRTSSANRETQPTTQHAEDILEHELHDMFCNESIEELNKMKDIVFNGGSK